MDSDLWIGVNYAKPPKPTGNETYLSILQDITTLTILTRKPLAQVVIANRGGVF